MYPEYRNNARAMERRFMRQMKKRGYFYTAAKQLNYVMEYTKEHVGILTNKGSKLIRLQRTMLRQAISFFYFKATTKRKELQCYTNYTSALFGILVNLFQSMSKLEKLKHGEFRLSLLGTLFFASGLERDPDIIKTILKPLQGKRILLNYKSLLESNLPYVLSLLEKYDLYAVIDSGAFSFYNEEQKQKKKPYQQLDLFSSTELEQWTLEGYSQFVCKYQSHPRILGFLPLDVIGDGEATRRNWERLRERAPHAKLFPVWQITDELEGLSDLVEEEPELICIGGMVPFILGNKKSYIKSILKKVFSLFPFQNFHALGVADELLIEFPFFSCDSTAYLNARRFGERKVYISSGERVEAPSHFTWKDIVFQNLSFLLDLENKGCRLSAF